MTVPDIQKTLDRLEQLMTGFNYEVTLGVDVFEDSPTLEIFEQKLVERYSHVQPGKSRPTVISKTEFKEELQSALAYRGDKWAGLTLTSEKENELINEQGKFLSFIDNYHTDSTQIYSYPESIGMAGYVVFWHFAFLLLNKERPSLLIAGSASD